MPDVLDTTRREGSVAPTGLRRVPRRASWVALFSGVVIAFTIQLLLSLLGSAIGIAGFGGSGTSSAETLGIASGVWWIASSAVAVFCAGYAAAWLAAVESRFGGALHGLVTFGVATMLTVYLISSAVSSLTGGGFSALNSVAPMVAGDVKDATAPISGDAHDASGAGDPAAAYLQQGPADPATMTPQEAQKEVATNLGTYRRREVAATTPRFTTVPFHVLAAPVITTMVDELALSFAKQLGLTTSPVPVPLGEFTILMLWHASYDRDPAHRWLRDVLARLGREAAWQDRAAQAH